MSTQIFTVKGMTCAHCVQAVSAELSNLAGVTSVQVDLATGAATLSSERPLAVADVAVAVEDAGYELVNR